MFNLGQELAVPHAAISQLIGQNHARRILEPFQQPPKETFGCFARWCIDRTLVTSAVSGRISADPGRDRHAERRHPVENAAPDFGFCPLIGQRPGVESPADDGLVAKHRGLDNASSIVT
jgi:hypothetical protein